MARNAQLNLRIKPVLKARLEKLAKQDRRTLSAYVENVLDEHVKTSSRKKKTSLAALAPSA
jgi:hypothetical protein